MTSRPIIIEICDLKKIFITLFIYQQIMMNNLTFKLKKYRLSIFMHGKYQFEQICIWHVHCNYSELLFIEMSTWSLFYFSWYSLVLSLTWEIFSLFNNSHDDASKNKTIIIVFLFSLIIYVNKRQLKTKRKKCFRINCETVMSVLLYFCRGN